MGSEHHALEVAARLGELKRRNGFTIREIAEAIGSHFSTVSSWLQGKKVPRREAVVALAELFDVTPDYILGRDALYIPTPDDVQETKEELANSPELALLMSTAKTATKEDILTAHAMLLALKKKEEGRNGS